MGRVFLPALLTALLVSACAVAVPAVAVPAVAAPSAAPAPVAVAQATVHAAVAPAIEATRREVGMAVVPVLVDAQAAVQAALPAPAPASPSGVSPAAVALIVRWEVSSAQHYARRLSRPIWPGGASGVTWGVGYDGGHQTAATIRHDWVDHPEAATLSTTSGVTGGRARAVLPAYRHVVTPYPLAFAVFDGSVLPAYRRAARRALGDGFDRLPPDAAGALVSLGYNRGWSFAGGRRAEMAVIRDTCVPAGDAGCIAAQLVAMCRLWPDVPGLCARRHDEARLALGSRP